MNKNGVSIQLAKELLRVFLTIDCDWHKKVKVWKISSLAKWFKFFNTTKHYRSAEEWEIFATFWHISLTPTAPRLWTYANISCQP